MDIDTLLLHTSKFDDRFGSVTTPLYQTSTYQQAYPGRDSGYCYTRTGNPTRDQLQVVLAALEEGADAFVFSTGMAAENAAMQILLKPGDRIVVPYDLYGGTHRILFNLMEPRWGVRPERVDFRNVDAVERAAKGARIVWCESPTNPRLDVYDLPKIAGRVKKQGALMIVDNTFATPMIQKPLTFGADVVMHSVTKYLNGHSDVVMGALITRDPKIAEQLKFIQNATGGGAAPFDCWLVLRGLRSFPVRFRQHCRNALEVAKYLETRKGVRRVYFPGSKRHETYAVAKKNMPLFGAMVSLETEGNSETAKAFVSNLKLFKLAESLGGTTSLSCYPALMTHAALGPEGRANIGLSDNLVRLSVGLESAKDLIADIDQALTRALKGVAKRKSVKTGRNGGTPARKPVRR